VNNITIIIDTREQHGLDFSKFRDVDVVRQGLKTGDYSIRGYEEHICFERKSVQDLVGTLIGGHERFLREMERMRDFEAKYILVEHTPTILYSYCVKHGWQYKFNTIIQSLLAYACHYQVRVRFCKDREDMAKYIVEKSRKFLKEKGEKQCQTNQETQP
jgi:ERCC4-type nuclease